MSYGLESTSEFERLEHMSTVPALDPRNELADVELAPGSRVLDVGCGSGFVVRYLGRRFPGSHILGCDASATRIDLARRAAEGIENVAFQVDDIVRPGLAPESFDFVHCRLVMEHLGSTDRELAARSLYAYVKPGGVLRIVSSDGSLLNIYPTPPLVTEMISILRGLSWIDLEVGRKIAPLLASLGVEALRIRIEADPFTSDAGSLEVIRAALGTLSSPLAKVVSSEERVAAMVRAYDDTLRLPGASATINKFIVTCRKPASA